MINDFFFISFEVCRLVFSKIPNTRNLFKEIINQENLDILFQNSCENLFKKPTKLI